MIEFSRKFQTARGADPKQEENAGQELGKGCEKCSLLATKRPERALWGTAGSYAASFVTTFVTMECAASLVCDPTILISCQS
jgi:hypothetical protein